MSRITTHVLDVALGRPAAGVAVGLARQDGSGTWLELAHAHTDQSGRIADFGAGALLAGVHRLSFASGEYFASSARPAFFPHVDICFVVLAPHEHHHVPLLLSPFGYSTYRGG